MSTKQDSHQLVVLLLSISLGYAFLKTDLTINGTSKINATSWNVYFDNVQITTGSTTLSEGDQIPTINPTTLTDITYTVTLKEPGDFYEFTVDVVNDGTLDAMIGTITNKLNNVEITTLPAYMSYTVTYSDDIPIAVNHLLEAGESETYKIRLSFRTDINPSDLPTEGATNTLSFGLSYVQADENAVPVVNTISFSTDSWETVVAAIKRGQTSAYHVGDTKTVTLGNSLGTHTIRIANTSTPAECGAEGFSQTACGFVLEFADTITNHRMNLYTSEDSNLDGSTVNGTGNKGGWEYSDMRAYLNSTTYANENIDYSTTGIYSSLPEVLRNAVIDTTVVSGHGSADTTNYTTTDKLYLLSRREIWNYTESDDTAQGQTRQLDYYANLGVTTSNYSGARKQRNGSNSFWWLRSANFIDAHGFRGVNSSGYWNYLNANFTYGVSPAFRIA